MMIITTIILKPRKAMIWAAYRAYKPPNTKSSSPSPSSSPSSSPPVVMAAATAAVAAAAATTTTTSTSTGTGTTETTPTSQIQGRDCDAAPKFQRRLVFSFSFTNVSFWIFVLRHLWVVSTAPAISHFFWIYAELREPMGTRKVPSMNLFPTVASVHIARWLPFIGCTYLRSEKYIY